MHADVLLALEVEEARAVLLGFNMVEASLHTSLQETHTTLEV